MRRSPFEFTVEEVFYVKPPVDRVILVGTVQQGTVRVGDPATVHCKHGEVNVQVEGIEAFPPADIQKATKSQQAGFKLRGITKDQPSKGDRVTGTSSG